jgi:hypothetical protein
VLLFEKAINVQYTQYMGKLSTQAATFFFVNPSYNVFYNDHRLVKYWLNPSKKQIDSLYKKMDEVEKELTAKEHSKIG